MIDALKTLFENDVVSEEIRAELEEAWNSKIKENRMQVTAELREEFAKKIVWERKFKTDGSSSPTHERRHVKRTKHRSHALPLNSDLIKAQFNSTINSP